jgi:biotin transport system substrate-specific component
MVLGNAVIYAIGATWLAAAIDVPLAKAVELGVQPFLLGDALKVALAAGLFPLAWRAVERFTKE